MEAELTNNSYVIQDAVPRELKRNKYLLLYLEFDAWSICEKMSSMHHIADVIHSVKTSDWDTNKLDSLFP